ncbi:MAG: glycosyl-4,4'-diaponeurosporenoate acyltransferase [Desulfobacterota bacterium]|nr:glycosyl-4,4'-diaponeurosporenoate acyltransferase [Thermodesulfobacteriota bacterium]
MRLIHLGTFWTVVVDVLAWLAIHLGAAFLLARLRPDTFDPENWLGRTRGWEREGDLYRIRFKIGKWKHRLPDAAPLLGSRGFPKKRLRGRSPAYLSLFLTETSRAETVHWVIILYAPLFFFWNPLWVGFLMVFYALAENLPLIMAQRYNRCRLAPARPPPLP